MTTITPVPAGVLQIDKPIPCEGGDIYILTSSIPTTEGRLSGRIPVWDYKGKQFRFLLSLN